VFEDVSELVDLAAVNQRRRPKRLGDGFVQRLGAVENDQQAAIGAQPTALKIGQETLANGGILSRSVPEAERVFGTRVIDAEGHHEAVFADVDAIDEQRHEIDPVKRGGSPSVELRRRFRNEPPAHRALARAAHGHRRRQRLETSRVPARRDAEQHLFDDPPIQRILARHQLKRRQRHFGVIAADPWPPNRHLPPTKHDLTRNGASPHGLALGLMLIARTADGRPILFQHRAEHLQAGRNGQFHQLRTHID
jgi:hypothetical protein